MSGGRAGCDERLGTSTTSSHPQQQRHPVRRPPDPTPHPLLRSRRCPEGPKGAAGQPGDLLRCSCGQRVRLLHFVGGVRGDPRLGALNATLLGMSGEQLKALAWLRSTQPDERERS